MKKILSRTLWVCILIIWLSLCFCFGHRIGRLKRRYTINTTGELITKDNIEDYPLLEKFIKERKIVEIKYTQKPPKKENKMPDIENNVLDYFWHRESRCGKDKRWKLPKATGEVGEYQIRPIFITDVERISGYTIDPMDNISCRKGIQIWLDHYVPLIDKDMGIEDQYEMYNRGYAGYKRWKGST